MKRSFSIIVVLVLFLSVLTYNNVKADAVPPTINNLYFNVSSATGGDFVTLTVEVYDMDGVGWASAGIYVRSNNTSMYVMYLELSPLVNGTGMVTLQGTFNVSQYWDNGFLYVGDMSIQDGVGNYGYYVNGTEFFSPTVQLSGLTPDHTPPELVSASFDRSVAYPNQNVTVLLNITETGSGVFDIYVEIGRIVNGSTYYSTFVSPQYNATTGLYDGTFWINPWWPSGNYSVTYVSITDYRNNYAYYAPYHGNVSLPTLQVVGTTPDTQGPIMSYIQFDQASVFAGSFLGIRIGATDDVSGPSVGWAYSYYKAPGDTYWSYLESTSLYYDTYSGAYLGDIYIPSNFTDNTLISVASLWLEDYAGNGNYYYNSTYTSNSTYISPIATVHNNVSMGNVFLTISPRNGVNDVGQEVIFSLDITSNSSSMISGFLDFYITGPEYISLFSGNISVSSYNSFYTSSAVTFNYEGNYSIVAYFYSNAGTFMDSTSWWVNPPPIGGGNESITVTVEPTNGESVVNETVEFYVSVTSTFRHTMPSVTLVLYLDDVTGRTNISTTVFSLSANSTTQVIVSVTFTKVGTFNLEAILYDDIGAPWSYQFSWTVVESSGVTDNPNQDTNSTSSAANNTASALPEISLPGFDLGLTAISLISMIIGTAIIQRKRKY